MFLLLALLQGAQGLEHTADRVILTATARVQPVHRHLPVLLSLVGVSNTQ